MKRNTIISKLADIGRNPVKLSKMSNDELRATMASETEALAARAAHNTRLAIVQQQERQRHMKRTAQRRAHEQQQAAAERYRMERISRPLPPIVTYSNVQPETVIVNTMIHQRRIQVRRLTGKLPYMGGADFRKAAEIIRGHKETIKALEADLV